MIINILNYNFNEVFFLFRKHTQARKHTSTTTRTYVSHNDSYSISHFFFMIIIYWYFSLDILLFWLFFNYKVEKQATNSYYVCKRKRNHNTYLKYTRKRNRKSTQRRNAWYVYRRVCVRVCRHTPLWYGEYIFSFL